jgi:chorismate synthase
MNSFGRMFRIHIFGESHGEATGVVLDGCPSGIALHPDDFTPDLQRRQGGLPGTTARKEQDVPKIISGLYNGFTTGAPLTILFENTNVRSDDYALFREIPRPGHADFAAMKKWNNFNDLRGGGHLSGRLTVALVAAGVVAKKCIGRITINAEITEAGGNVNIKEAIDKAVKDEETIGGIITCRAHNIPVGLGEPFFDSTESLISHLLFSIPAVKAVEFGAGFEAARMTGSQNNDPIISIDGTTSTNHAGGITGGITNGNDVFFRIAVKPAASIPKSQETLNIVTGKPASLQVQGRHDTCIALRMPVIVEAVTAIILCDLLKS